MSVRDFATRKITAALPGLAAKAASDLNSAIGLRDKLARYWGAAFMTVLLSEEPETFAQFTPRDLKLVQPHVTGDGFLETSVEIDCGLRIAVGERPDDQVYLRRCQRQRLYPRSTIYFRCTFPLVFL
jgi:Domain of unknown function (DUF4403)